MAPKIHKYQRFKNPQMPVAAGAFAIAAPAALGLRFIVTESDWVTLETLLVAVACFAIVVENRLSFSFKGY